MTASLDRRRERAWAWAQWSVTIALAVAAAVTVGFGIVLALDRADSEALESPLLLAITHQLRAGPWELYGPYWAGNHLVLIHAPFYYHLSALLAWPLARLGVDPISAALIAGRSLSFMGLVAIAVLAYRLARLDGAPVAAGLWSALLVAGAPAMGSMPYTVRPDLLGIAFQTVGVLLVLMAVRGDGPGGRKLLAAYAAFALAFCTKQHFIVAAAISTVLAIPAARRHRALRKNLERGLLLACAIVAVLLGAEELLTGGRMSQAIFLAARSAGAIHPGGWSRAEIVALAAAHASEGLLTLLMAAGLGAAWRFGGFALRAIAAVGAMLIGLVVVLAFGQSLISSLELPIALLGAVALAVPFWVATGLFGCRRDAFGERLDGLLWLYFVGEMAVFVVLCRASTGSWFNYAIGGAVFLAVLAGRAAARALDSIARFGEGEAPAAPGSAPAEPSSISARREPRPPSAETRLAFVPQLAIAAAALGCLGSAAFSVRYTERTRRLDRVAIETLLERDHCPPEAVFVVDQPGMNRLHGRLDLVFDEWLYPVFEELGLAEPRASWLRRSLTAGGIQYVVKRGNDPRVAGVPEPLRKLGFLPKYQVGPFYVWQKGPRHIE
jgi:hypothetical protein